MSIKVLDPILSSRIAAGEVIDRPASVLRELLDNSIDAGATKITINIEEGGISLLSVEDNGCGMSSQDLLIACRSHATSKINTVDDLYNITTLGFRGEALSSISSCSTLTIQSNGNKIICDNGIQSEILPDMHFSDGKTGTRITMENLFDKIPARKQFLKRPSTEAQECKKTVLEKALGFENTEFVFLVNNKVELNLKSSSKVQRVLDIYGLDGKFSKPDTLTMNFEAIPVKLFAISSNPSQYEHNRSKIRIFVNNREIECYQLVQAIYSSYSAVLPGGAFPYFCLFIENSPTLVDFNIHPTKRECKIRNQSAIYSMITKMIRDRFMHNANSHEEKEENNQSLPHLNTNFEPKQTNAEYKQKPMFERTFGEKTAKFDSSWFDQAKLVINKTKVEPTVKVQEKQQWKYIGQVFNTFLVVETQDNILFIDQHAAHERILYDKIKANPDRQDLIISYKFETDAGCDDYLKENSVLYQEFGIGLVRCGDLEWEITSLPAMCRNDEEKIASYIKNATGDFIQVEKGLFAIMACHSAIKAGDVLDNITSINLIEKVFELDQMVCPHGRSFVYSISKNTLYREVGRII